MKELVYIFDEKSKTESLGTLTDTPIYSGEDLAGVNTKLNIFHSAPLGQMLADYISLDCFTILNSFNYKSNDYFYITSISEYIDLPIFKRFFDARQATTYDLLEAVNLIFAFREYIEICNKNKNYFSEVHLRKFFDVLGGEYNSIYDVALVCGLEDFSVSKKYSWLVEYPQPSLSFENVKVNPWSLDPESKAKLVRTGILNSENVKVNPWSLDPESNAKLVRNSILNMESAPEDNFSSIVPILGFRTPFNVYCESLRNLVREGLLIKKCKSCGKYFSSYKRADALYCDRISPFDSSMTCKKYGGRETWSKTLQENETASLYRKIYMAKQMRVKRNPDKSFYQSDFEDFKKTASEWKQTVKLYEDKTEDYLSWLKSVKDNKAGDTNGDDKKA